MCGDIVNVVNPRFPQVAASSNEGDVLYHARLLASNLQIDPCSLTIWAKSLVSTKVPRVISQMPQRWT